MPEQYSFTSIWKLKASLEDIWYAIYYSEDWPYWWKDFVSVTEIEKGDEQSIGSIRIYKLKSPFVYTLSFSLLLTRRKDFQYLEGQAGGELQGTGAWKFEESEGVTTVTCHWQVATNIGWMNKFAFLLKPLFKYNHSLVMKRGAKYLADKLKAELIDVSSN